MHSRLRRKFGILFSFGPLAALLIISFQNTTPTNAASVESAKASLPFKCNLNSTPSIFDPNKSVQRICR